MGGCLRAGVCVCVRHRGDGDNDTSANHFNDVEALLERKEVTEGQKEKVIQDG